MTASDSYAARPWRRWYAAGVIDRVNVPDVSLSYFLESAAAEFPRRKALHFLGKSMTYAALDSAVDRFASALHELGVRKGD